MASAGTPGPIQRIALLGLRIAGALAFLAPLLTRLVIGQSFFFTGRGKLANFERTVSFFTDLGIPFPSANAGFVSTLEMVGGICLFVGFGTRIFAGLLSCSMIVALLTADKPAFLEKFPDVTDVTSAAYLLFLIWLVFYGPGPVSIDRFLSKWLGLEAKSEPEGAAPPG